MASDSKQYEYALERWHELHERGEYSRPESTGLTTIFYTQAVYDSRLFEDTSHTDQIRNRELELYQQEAEMIACEIRSNGYECEIIEGPTKQDFIDVLCDRDVTSIVTIGSGSLQTLILDSEGEDIITSVSWRDVANTMDHLKLGYFEQRQCGHIMPHCAAVPLGALAMSSFSNVFAAAGYYFTPDVPMGNSESIMPITNKHFLSYSEIRKLCIELKGDISSLDPPAA